MISQSTRVPGNLEVLRVICSHKGLSDFQDNFKKIMLWGCEGLDTGLPDGGHSFTNHTQPYLSFLWGDRKEVWGKHQLFSKLTEGRRHLHPLPSLFSSRYALTSLTPTFFPSQFPPLWLAGLFSLLSNKRNKGGRVTFPFPLSHPAQRRGVQTCRPLFLKLRKASTAKKCLHAKFLDVQEKQLE